jgi:hypothetical protein
LKSTAAPLDHAFKHGAFEINSKISVLNAVQILTLCAAAMVGQAHPADP